MRHYCSLININPSVLYGEATSRNSHNILKKDEEKCFPPPPLLQSSAVVIKNISSVQIHISQQRFVRQFNPGLVTVRLNFNPNLAICPKKNFRVFLLCSKNFPCAVARSLGKFF